MITRLHLEIAAAVALAGTGIVALHEHDAHIQEQAVSAATQKAQDTFQKQLQQLTADFDAKIKVRDDAYQRETTDLNQKFADAAKNTAQMAALLSQLAKLPVPIQVTVPAPTKENPNPQPVVTVPQIDFPAFQLYAQECEQCRLDRAKVAAD